MTMTERTRKAIETLHNEYARVEFTRAELEKVSAVSIDTLIRYRAVQAVRYEQLIPVSVTELVRLLNDCAGADCYSCNWEYIEQDGQAFRVEHLTFYRVL
jgi:hypothetical protein